MQFKIPQNVRREDKIVGPLTLKQLITMGVGGGITYAVYTLLARNYFIEVWLVPTIITGGLTLAFTFLKINGNPFGKWILLLVEFTMNTKKRTFTLGAADVRMPSKKEVKKESKPEEKSKAERDRERLEKISEITKLVDSTPRHG